MLLSQVLTSRSNPQVSFFDFGLATTHRANALGDRSNHTVQDNPQRFQTDVKRIQSHAHAHAERVDARLVYDMQQGLEGFVRHERNDIQDTDLNQVGFQEEATNQTGLARIDDTPNEKHKEFGNFQEDLCTLLHAVLEALDALVAAIPM